jgi:hypothetical protein
MRFLEQQAAQNDCDLNQKFKFLFELNVNYPDYTSGSLPIYCSLHILTDSENMEGNTTKANNANRKAPSVSFDLHFIDSSPESNPGFCPDPGEVNNVGNSINAKTALLACDMETKEDNGDVGVSPATDGTRNGYNGPPLPDGCVPISTPMDDKDSDQRPRKERKRPKPCMKKQQSVNLCDAELEARDGPPEADYVGNIGNINSRRQQCIQTFFTFIYILLAGVAVVFTYALIYDLVNSMNNPVRSIHYSAVQQYDAPGKYDYFISQHTICCDIA